MLALRLRSSPSTRPSAALLHSNRLGPDPCGWGGLYSAHSQDSRCHTSKRFVERLHSEHARKRATRHGRPWDFHSAHAKGAAGCFHDTKSSPRGRGDSIVLSPRFCTSAPVELATEPPPAQRRDGHDCVQHGRTQPSHVASGETSAARLKALRLRCRHNQT